MELENIILIGSSGQAKVVIDIVENEKKYNIVGLIDRFRKKGEKTLGYKILGKEEDIPQLFQEYNLSGGIIAIGDNWSRKVVYQKIKDLFPNFSLKTAVHPSAQISKYVCIGKGTVIMANAVVNPGCKIGDNCIINTKASIDHDCQIGNYSSIAPGCTLSGNVMVGENTSISLGAKILEKIKIGSNSIIGAGSVLTKDASDYSIYYGVPAKFIRKRKKDEKYLK